MGILKKISDKVFASNMKKGAQAASDICYAAENGDVVTLKELFKGTTYAGAGTIANYALVGACEAGQVETARFMLEFGVPPDIEIGSGETPVAAATRNNHLEVLALLHDYTIEGGGRPAPLLVAAKHEREKELEKKRQQQAAADAPSAAILQRNIKARKKPLKFNSKKA